jgi:hypothetical protein
MAGHTTSGEWQSFELRMRRRRVERLVLRAEAAAEAGFIDEAREAIDEARRLEPSFPDVARVEERLQRPRVLTAELDLPLALDDAPARKAESDLVLAPALDDVVPTEGGNHRVLARTAAVIVLVALSGAAGYYAMTREAALEPAYEFFAAAPAIDAPPPASIVPAPAAPPIVDTQPVSTTGTTGTGDPAGAAVMDARGLETTSPPVAPVLLRESTPPRTVPEPERPAPIDRSDARATADPIEPPAARLSGAPNEALPAAPPPVIPAAPPAARDSNAASAADTVPEPAEPAVTQAAVRTALNRYAAAYSDLDADAARRVWPGVNRDALARAFDTLASQRVSLGDCSIDVTGPRASARCAGSTTWRPKVGNASARTDARTWTFELSKAGDDWTIVSARVQNR